MIGVSICTLVSLRPVGPHIQALVTACDRNVIVGGERPSLLLRAAVRLPNLGWIVVALGHTCIEGIVGARDDDRSGTGRNIPVSSGYTVSGYETNAVGWVCPGWKR